MAENLANEFATTLTADIDAVQTAIAVASGTGSPDVNFRIRIGSELMLVTNKGAGTNWTVTRSVEGSTPAAHLAGEEVVHVLTTAGLAAFVADRYQPLDAGLSLLAAGGDTPALLRNTLELGQGNLVTFAAVSVTNFVAANSLLANLDVISAYGEFGTLYVSEPGSWELPSFQLGAGHGLYEDPQGNGMAVKNSLSAIRMSNDGNGAQLRFHKSRGGTGAESAVLNLNTIGALNFRGFGTTVWGGDSAAIRGVAAEAFTDTAKGGILSFHTQTIGTVSGVVERMRVTGLGNVLIGTTTDDTFRRLQVSGDASVSGNAAFGGVGQANATYIQGFIDHNRAGAFGGADTSVAIANRLPSALTGVSAQGWSAIWQLPVSGTVGTTAFYGISLRNDTPNVAVTYTELVGLMIQSTVKGAASTVTFWTGLEVRPQTGMGTTFAARLRIAAGANQWNLYAEGTANNYMAGRLLLASTTDDASSAIQLGAGGSSATTRTSVLFRPGGFASPAAGVANSDGDKLVFWNDTVKYAIGLGAAAMWYQSFQRHEFYAGATKFLQLDQNGVLTFSNSSAQNILVLTSSNTTATAISFENTDTGGKQWLFFSTGTVATGGAGNFGIYNNTDGRFGLYVLGSATGGITVGTTSTMITNLDGSSLIQLGDSDAAGSTPRTNIRYRNGGFAAPVVNNTLSNGDKLVFWNSASFKGALGIEGAGMWFQCSGSSNTTGFRWYGSTGSPTLQMALVPGGDLLIGGSTAVRSVGSSLPRVQIEATAGGKAMVSLVANNNDPVGNAQLRISRSRGSVLGSNTIVQNGDAVGYVAWTAADGNDLDSFTAYIGSFVDGVPGSNDMPGSLEFFTTADGAASGTSRVKIGSQGNVILNNTGVALATNATGGFTYIPTCAGTPTGTPAVLPTGALPVVIDSTNHKLYFYSGGAWRDAGP